MRKIAVLVIAALHQPVYRHYIRSYWTDVIEHTNASLPNVDVFLLIEHGTDRTPFAHLDENIIEDPTADMATLCPARHIRPGIPSILSKTVHALDELQGDYDVYFRTNLSSLIKISAFDEFVQTRDRIDYSGAWVWSDGLREDLVRHGWVGRGRSVDDLGNLDHYPGNTFISGSGFFLNANEARSLVARRGTICWGIPDDVAVGLMFAYHEMLNDFSMIVEPELEVEEMVRQLRSHPAVHVRLQHFPLERAQQLWAKLRDDPIWM